MGWHINTKELIAVKRLVESALIEGDCLQIGMDSKTAVAFINRMGGTRSKILCDIALDIWKLVLAKDAWLKATWLPRENNQLSDMLSKESLMTWEFGIARPIIMNLWRRWFVPEVDCFASNRFHVLPRYYSILPDPLAMQRDAFSVI